MQLNVNSVQLNPIQFISSPLSVIQFHSVSESSIGPSLPVGSCRLCPVLVQAKFLSLLVPSLLALLHKASNPLLQSPKSCKIAHPRNAYDRNPSTTSGTIRGP